MEILNKYKEREVAVLSFSKGNVIYHKGLLKNINNNNLILEDHIIEFDDIIAVSSSWSKEIIYYNPKYNDLKSALWNVEQPKRIIKEELLVEWNTLDIDPLFKSIVEEYLEDLSNGMNPEEVYIKIIEEYDDIEIIKSIEKMIIKYSPKGESYYNYLAMEKEGLKK